MRVLVVGAGVVGLASAYELSLRGHQVVVVEAAGGPGVGASGGNGAQLSYSYVQPLADPAIWRQLPKLLLTSDSPLRFDLKIDWQQWRWLAQFMRACNRLQSEVTTQKLLTLGAVSKQRVDALMANESIRCDFQTAGKLVIYRDPKAFEAAQRQLNFQRQLALGGEQQAIDLDAVLRLEPALQGACADIVGAIHTPSECALDCQKLCDELVRLLRLKGVEFRFNSFVQRLDVEGDVAKSVTVEEGAADGAEIRSLSADSFVVCSGYRAPDLLRSLGVNSPVYPLKGYSITALVNGFCRPRINLTDHSRKMVFAPLGSGTNSRLRVAGYAEIVGRDSRVDPSRIAGLVAATRAVYPETEFSAGNVLPWMGFRPATPTGLPMVGRRKGLPNNVRLNIGHGALGLTLAFGTAFQLAAEC
jgi:D-amino-acid dehydrogenase